MKVFAMERRISTLALLSLMLSCVGAIEVKIPERTFEFARGDNITLPCTFKTALKDAPKLVIVSWAVEADKADEEDIVILTYYSSGGTTDITSSYEGRVSLDIDVPTGKADLKLSSITLADNKNFVCRVQIPGDKEGSPSDSRQLVVLVAPSQPICKIQGRAEYGQNINLTCLSEEASPPPTYKWESRDVQNIPRRLDPRTTDKGGILSLYNISKDTSGFYICTSSNKIRSATCNITVAVMPPSMNIGSTAGIIGGAVALLIILIIIIYCCCCRKKNKEEEYAMGVREEEYHDKQPAKNGDSHQNDGQEGNPADRRARNERSHDHDRDYENARSDYDDRRSDYDDRRSDYDDRRSDYNDRRSDYDDRRDRYSDRNERYDDRRHYDDERRYNDSRDRRNDRDLPPPVPSNKPQRNYDN